jgi:hypothetical protein
LVQGNPLKKDTIASLQGAVPTAKDYQVRTPITTAPFCAKNPTLRCSCYASSSEVHPWRRYAPRVGRRHSTGEPSTVRPKVSTHD